MLEKGLEEPICHGWKNMGPASLRSEVELVAYWLAFPLPEPLKPISRPVRDPQCRAPEHLASIPKVPAASSGMVQSPASSRPALLTSSALSWVCHVPFAKHQETICLLVYSHLRW